jgi:hypothetical protein
MTSSTRGSVATSKALLAHPRIYENITARLTSVPAESPMVTQFIEKTSKKLTVC